MRRDYALTKKVSQVVLLKYHNTLAKNQYHDTICDNFCEKYYYTCSDTVKSIVMLHRCDIVSRY